MFGFSILGAGDLEVSPLFGLLTLVLIGVVLVSLVLQKFRQSLLVGYFLCGVVLANSGVLDWVQASSEDFDLLAELGIILLLFTLGLEFSLEEMKHLRRVALVAGGWQVGLVTLIGGSVAWALNLSVSESVALGVGLALSSTAVSIKSFQDLGQADSPGARVALGVAIFQDLLVIFFMIILPALLGRGEGSMLAELGLAMLQGAVFLGACWFLSRRGIPQLLHAVARTRSRELFTVTVIGLCAAVAFGAVQLNLSAALGAFAAGLVVSESMYSHRVLADILPFKDLFLTIFFVSVGLLVDLSAVAENWVIILVATVAILVVKFGVAFFAARRLGVALRPCLLAGAALASTGEFSLILFDRISDLVNLDERITQVLLASTAISMGLVPSLMRWLGNLAPTLERKGWFKERATDLDGLTLEGEIGALKDHIIICGYGPVGRNLCHALMKCQLPVLVLELNPDTVRDLRRQGVKAIFADARQPEALELAQVERARGIAFTFPDAETAIAGMKLAHEKNPEIIVYARAKFSPEARRLGEHGAKVFHDERESGQAMIRSVVSCYDEEDVYEDYAW